jgi:hypothetical protein
MTNIERGNQLFINNATITTITTTLFYLPINRKLVQILDVWICESTTHHKGRYICVNKKCVKNTHTKLTKVTQTGHCVKIVKVRLSYTPRTSMHKNLYSIMITQQVNFMTFYRRVNNFLIRTNQSNVTFEYNKDNKKVRVQNKKTQFQIIKSP